MKPLSKETPPNDEFDWVLYENPNYRETAREYERAKFCWAAQATEENAATLSRHWHDHHPKAFRYDKPDWLRPGAFLIYGYSKGSHKTLVPEHVVGWSSEMNGWVKAAPKPYYTTLGECVIGQEYRVSLTGAWFRKANDRGDDGLIVQALPYVPETVLFGLVKAVGRIDAITNKRITKVETVLAIDGKTTKTFVTVDNNSSLKRLHEDSLIKVLKE